MKRSKPPKTSRSPVQTAKMDDLPRWLDAYYSWRYFYIIDGTLAIGLGVLLHIFATVVLILQEKDSGAYAAWIGIQSIVLMAQYLFSLRILAPYLWKNEESSMMMGFMCHFAKATCLFGIVSSLVYLDFIRRSTNPLLMGVFALLCLIRSLIVMYYFVHKVALMYFKKNNVPITCQSACDPKTDSLLFWLYYVAAFVTSAAPGVTPASERLAVILYIISQPILCVLTLYVVFRKDKSHSVVFICLTFSATCGSVLPFAIMLTFESIRNLNSIILILYIYVAMTCFTKLVIEALDILPINNEDSREVLGLVLYPLQLFQEFAVVILFFEVELVSVTYWALLGVVTIVDFCFESGWTDEMYFDYIKRRWRKTQREKLVFMAKKCQYIRQKMLASSIVLVSVTLMFVIEWKFGPVLGATLISSFLGRPITGASLTGYLILLAAHVILTQLTSRLLARRMKKIKVVAMLEARNSKNALGQSILISRYKASRRRPTDSVSKAPVTPKTFANHQSKPIGLNSRWIESGRTSGGSRLDSLITIPQITDLKLKRGLSRDIARRMFTSSLHGPASKSPVLTPGISPKSLVAPFPWKPSPGLSIDVSANTHSMPSIVALPKLTTLEENARDAGNACEAAVTIDPASTSATLEVASDASRISHRRESNAQDNTSEPRTSRQATSSQSEVIDPRYSAWFSSVNLKEISAHRELFVSGSLMGMITPLWVAMLVVSRQE